MMGSLRATTNPNGDRTPDLADLERMLSGRTEVNGMGQLPPWDGKPSSPQLPSILEG
jgi:hypothetical protein